MKENAAIPKVERGVIAEAFRGAKVNEPCLNSYTFRARFRNGNPDALTLVAGVVAKRRALREKAIRTINDSGRASV